MLIKIAELWMTQKEKPDRAAKAYEKVLELDENNLAAAERLIPIYTTANNPKGFATAIEVKLGHEQEPDDSLGLLREVAASTSRASTTKPRRSSATWPRSSSRPPTRRARPTSSAPRKSPRAGTTSSPPTARPC